MVAHQVLGERRYSEQLDRQRRNAVRMIVIIGDKIVHQPAVVSGEYLKNSIIQFKYFFVQLCPIAKKKKKKLTVAKSRLASGSMSNPAINSLCQADRAAFHNWVSERRTDSSSDTSESRVMGCW